jgi:hypothetical protein
MRHLPFISPDNWEFTVSLSLFSKTIFSEASSHGFGICNFFQHVLANNKRTFVSEAFVHIEVIQNVIHQSQELFCVLIFNTSSISSVVIEYTLSSSVLISNCEI